jgi:DNA-directed RNA polymerase subunit N (RpoN/RPB10)|tara:strand:+ start:5438 stop:5650 length:213 start_codon:yes stop_codon:yes gene_type:complete
MIIPIRCFTCGTLIADKYKTFLKELEKKEKKENIDSQNRNLEEIFCNLKLKRYCCRRMLYTQSNILNKLK